MPVFKSMRELKAFVQDKINAALGDEVFEEVRRVELESIADIALDVYEPAEYARRDTRGIDDPENIIAAPAVNGVLEVENITSFNPDYDTENTGQGLVGLIENGYGWNGFHYDYPYNRKFTRPRRFISHTRDELEESGGHVNALKKGLIKRGLKVK